MIDDSADDPAELPDEDNELDDPVELTPQQAANLRRAMSNIPLPEFRLPESLLKNIVDAQRSLSSEYLEPLHDTQAEWQKRFSASITSDTLKSVEQIFEQLNKQVDFSGIAQSLKTVAKINTTFAAQQTTLFKNIGSAIESMRTGFYPSNLRSIEGLDFEDVDAVVMTDGIPLYGLPRTTTAEALIRAENTSKRREILDWRWETISADCRETVLSCSSKSVAPYALFAVSALDALDAGHTDAAQALAGSLVDTIVTGHFGSDRYKYTPNKNTKTTDAYDEFTVREYIAFAPMWQTYQPFFVSNGDKVPIQFSRHATVHAVSKHQYNRPNAVQALMFVCSLLYRINEESD
ncbi:hypothetical protein [Dietzia kunjamensis]|uniref:hypothetical protein n=1 Tax=Dietzia kunjamensis TaxID=322509 RepID=UPI00209747BE|nr:hypothetical protein [Dietzia kunjamensis]USX47735.1 hypothetical protein NHB83_17610 [Dietzia kunjamensis]